MDHPDITSIERTGYPLEMYRKKDMFEDDTERECDICCIAHYVLIKNDVKYCRKCAKDAGVLRVNRDPFYPDTLFEEDGYE